MRIVLHREIPEDARLRKQWNDLVLQMTPPEVFFTYEWAHAMQSGYGSVLQPWLFLGYEGDVLTGVAALALDPAGKKISFLASTTADYCDFISAPQHREEFVSQVSRELTAELLEKRAVKLALANLPADSATVTALKDAARRHNLHIFMRPAYACSQVELGNAQQRRELKGEVLRKKTFQRKLRGLERAGRVSYAHLQTWEQIRPRLQIFMNAHAARFQATGRTSPLASVERRNFVEDLAMRFSNSGVATMSVLMLNDEPIAWNYGFRFQGSWFWYQPTFDGHWQEFSPGYCLLTRIIADACDLEEINRIDLGLGNEGYKERFGNSARQTIHVTVSRSRYRHLREIARYRAVSLVSRAPAVENAVRRMLGR